MPSKRVIVLDQLPQPGNIFRVALWADVPAARQSFYANPDLKSAWSGAQAADNTALQNGSVTERVEIYNAAAGKTLAQIKTDLQNLWTAFQSYVNSYNPWSRYGTFMDNTNTWTDAGAS